MRSKKQGSSGSAHPVQFAQRGAPVFPPGNLHHAIEHKQRPLKVTLPKYFVYRMAGYRVTYWVTRRQGGCIGVQEGDAVGLAFGGESARLVEEFLGKIEGREFSVAERPKAEGNSASAATGFDQGCLAVSEIALDEQSLRTPKPQFVRGARIVDDRRKIIEIIPDGGGGYFLSGGQRGQKIHLTRSYSAGLPRNTRKTRNSEGVRQA